jgi:hypothetical protein
VRELELRIPDRYEHLGLWTPQVKERGPLLDFASWPPNASLPLTYHPFPTSLDPAAAPRA